MERLACGFPACVSELTLQYRMNQQIQTLANHLIYDGKLQCGNDEVRNRKVTVKEVQGGLIKNNCSGWLSAVLDPERRVVFLDTQDLCPEVLETKQENVFEAEICQKIVQEMAVFFSDSESIAILSPYRRQLALLKDVLFFRNNNSSINTESSEISESENLINKRRISEKRVEILTVDEAQGRDKSVILVSLVRSNADRKIGQLLQDKRRLNVLLTRAQKKLILIGSGVTLEKEPLLQNLLNLCKQQNWVEKYTTI